ncbi:hypothetical protein H0H92_006387 [Tricholoma furcatifolium]|nr:hypothetical protein H0H92_006387 [Tricholoma furcatifolium]
MTTKQGPFVELLPAEVYPLIVAHLPLYATPSTLLALALTNHRISEIVLPLLHSCLILKNEGDALFILQKLSSDPDFGRLVRELHIMSDLSLQTQNRRTSDVISLVVDIISQGNLPFLYALGLHLSSWWYYDDRNNFESVDGFARFEKGWWLKIKERCPRLRTIVLDGFREDDENPWIEESGMLYVPGITDLSLSLFSVPSSDDPTINIAKLSQHMSSLACSLDSLYFYTPGVEFPSLILGAHFPCLRSLTLDGFEPDTEEAMSFWERHPSIEYLDLRSHERSNNWFTSPLPDNLLPNLLHLRVRWKYALCLAPILGQLLSLAIFYTVNAQIPYLLRYVCRNGLPKLKSLAIGQRPSSDKRNKKREGSLWYESDDGSFRQGTCRSSRTVFDGFMHSIVRAAPNLEEIGFHVGECYFSKLVSIASDLNNLTSLKHLYYIDDGYRGESGTVPPDDIKRDILASQVKDFADAVPGLETVTCKVTLYPPYLTARITRHQDNRVESVDVGNGYWMKVGSDDQAFPTDLWDCT